MLAVTARGVVICVKTELPIGFVTAGIDLGESAELIIGGTNMLLRELVMGVVVVAVVVVVVKAIELLLISLDGNRGKFLNRLKLLSLGFIIS